MGLHQLRSFNTAEETISKVNRKQQRQQTEQEEIFANYKPDRGLISKIYKDPKELNNNKTKSALEVGNIHEQTFLKNEI